MFDIARHPSDSRLRQFAALWLLFSLGLLIHWSWPAAEFTLGRRPAYLGILAATSAVGIGIIGLFKPQLLRPIYLGWMIAVSPVGWTVSRMILAILFYGVFTPIALLFRMMGRDGLFLKLQPEADSYWIPKDSPGDPRRYLHQY
jgi:hypothetical protein